MMKPDSEKQFVGPVLEALSHYNKTKHSSTNRKPIEIEFEDLSAETKKEIHNQLKEVQRERLGRANKNREEREIDPTYHKIEERNKIRPLYRKVNGRLHENEDYVVDSKGKKYYKAVFRKKKKRFNH